MNNQDSITVITVTRKRPDKLRRAIASVKNQDYSGHVEHLVVIDDDSASYKELITPHLLTNRSLNWHNQKRPPHEIGKESAERASVYPRLARLLNIGIKMAVGPWIAFLDDDNEYEPNHLASLTEFAKKNQCQAVHSTRSLHWADGSPYLDAYFPGAPNAEEGSRIYELMCERGVCERGSNVLSDRVDPVQCSYQNSTVIGSQDPIFLVDQNLWLIERSILQRFPIPESFSFQEIESNTCPDDKMLEVLMRNQIQILSTERPTVRYYLGGISNGDTHQGDEKSLSCLRPTS